jgi:hypothetical protein
MRPARQKLAMTGAGFDWAGAVCMEERRIFFPALLNWKSMMW